MLDKQQESIVRDESDYTLVVAGAGSGKTLTILGKINYLTHNNIKPEEIICISFTKAASTSLKQKIKETLNLDIPVYTFHKLALNILGNMYMIADSDTLDYIIDEFFIETEHFENNLVKKLDKKELKNLKTLLSTFIHLFKCNGYGLEDFNSILKKSKRIFNFNYKKEKKFLILALNIYLKYQKYLMDNDMIDFDDMLILANKKVKENYNNKIKYIIIDEYQDTSFIRFNLIKSIIDKTNSKLLVVGDDFQSIYRFTGCDINLFLDFNKYFENSKIMKIENTYRNSMELIKIAGSFVMKNKRQIKKDLKSNKHLKNPIDIVCYKNKDSFLKLLKKVYKEDEELLVLGRNNNDLNYYIKDYKKIDDYIYYKDMKFKYMTVHRSKGLESDNVIIINMKDDILGFPSKIKEENILKYITKYDKYPFSEERRLFYVGLTRTKNKVYLYTPINNKSTFVKELIKDYHIKPSMI